MVRWAQGGVEFGEVGTRRGRVWWAGHREGWGLVGWVQGVVEFDRVGTGRGGV